MKKVLLISAHFDDAVLSAGQFLAGRPDADVMTVFGGYPKEIHETPYDKKCGFKDSSDAVSSRRKEDIEALSLLHANHIHLDFTDSQYNEDNSDWDISVAILEKLEFNEYEFIVAPIGLGHEDHIKVANIVKNIKTDVPKYFWEDLPLRVVQPELVQPRLNELGLTELVDIGTGPIADKVRALWCYKSQINTGILDPYLMYVPERFWK